MVEILESKEIEGVYYIVDPDNLPVYKGFINLDEKRIYFAETCELKEDELKEVMKIFTQD